MFLVSFLRNSSEDWIDRSYANFLVVLVSDDQVMIKKSWMCFCIIKKYSGIDGAEKGGGESVFEWTQWERKLGIEDKLEILD